MAVTMKFEPGKVVTWEEFKHYPRYSIAVDGYCAGRPRSSAYGRRLNINHHEGVDRLATRSSCDQALCLVKLGLFDTFQKDGVPEATIFLNDCDPDVALATYILMHPQHADRPKLKQLVRVEDLLDISAGLFPMKKKGQIVRQLAWIAEPYLRLRAEGRLGELDSAGMKALVEKMHRRIRKAIFGRVKEVALDTRYEILASFEGWKLVRENGLNARMGMAEDGIQAFASLVESGEGSYRYSLIRLSRFVPFPIPLFYDDLNGAEGIQDDAPDRWGGSETCGGSPRQAGSRLPPERLAAIINARMAQEEQRHSF
jgi:hypothetical protein